MHQNPCFWKNCLFGVKKCILPQNKSCSKNFELLYASNMVRPSPVERLVTNTALSKSSETGDLHQNDQERLRLWRHPSFSLSPPQTQFWDAGEPPQFWDADEAHKKVHVHVPNFCHHPLRMIWMAPYSIISSSSTGALCAMESPSKGSSDNGGHNFYPGILVPIRPIAIIEKGDKHSEWNGLTDPLLEKREEALGWSRRCHHAITWSDLARLSVLLPTLLYQRAVRLVICTRMTRSSLGSGTCSPLLSSSTPSHPQWSASHFESSQLSLDLQLLFKRVRINRLHWYSVSCKFCFYICNKNLGSSAPLFLVWAQAQSPGLYSLHMVQYPSVVVMAIIKCHLPPGVYILGCRWCWWRPPAQDGNFITYIPENLAFYI